MKSCGLAAVLITAAVHATAQTPVPAGAAQPALSGAALAACVALEREARSRHRDHAKAGILVENEGRLIDRERELIDARKSATDSHDHAAVAAYNHQVTRFDARVREHNASIERLKSDELAQRAAAERFNRDCGGKSYLPAELKAQ